MDFLRIDENEQLTMRVPLHFLNEESCEGVKSGGGVISHLMTELEIVCLPRDLPEYIELDVGSLELGDALHLSDITVPDGVEIAVLLQGGDPAQSVVSVQLPRIEIEPEELEEEVVEGDVEDDAEPTDEAGDAEPDGDES